jgi:carbonic anhydrase
MRTRTRETLEPLTPTRAFDLLVEGNRRFVGNLRVNRNLLQQVNETSEGQHPFAIVLSCIDSRTSAELVFDQGLGDIFSVRVAGSVLNEDVLGSMEFACRVAAANLIVVLGHTRCGAIRSACDGVQLGHLTALLHKIGPSVELVRRRDGDALSAEVLADRVALENMRHQLDQIFTRSVILRDLFDQGRIGAVGGMYSVETGEVTFVERRLHDPAYEQAQVAITPP